MNLLGEIEQMIGNEHLCDSEQINSLSVIDIKELLTNFLAQPHANDICHVTY